MKPFDSPQTTLGDLGIPEVTRFGDFREVEGVRFPFRLVAENPLSGTTTVQVQSIEARVELDADTFARPPNLR